MLHGKKQTLFSSPEEVKDCIDAIGGLPVSLWPVDSGENLYRFFVFREQDILPRARDAFGASPKHQVVVKKISFRP